MGYVCNMIKNDFKNSILNKINNKTKPLNALGFLEDIALQVAIIQQTETPQITKPTIVVFAADHGIAANGLVNPFPQAVTAQMVLNFANGGAAINVFCKQNNINLHVVDAGVNFVFEKSLPILHHKIAMGTAPYNLGPAATIAQINQAFSAGELIVENIFNLGCNTIGFGEMGIGNTSSAALIMHYYTQLSISLCVGRGTGANDELLTQKTKILEAVSTFFNFANSEILPKDLLCKIGGFEIAMMAGAYLKAAEQNMVIVVDGFIATSALMIAHAINKNILSHCIFAHCSNENGHKNMLTYFNATPVLNLNLRLGEGTGAALAMPIIQNAVAFLNNMASFEAAGVSEKI
jgi:nicotinate-nucleotide--dimethylbenzimidazole phosphoribosyltransferase